MSIRMLAKELYRVKKEVEELERRLEAAALDAPERNELEGRLRSARAEEEHVRSMLEGAKAS